MSDDDVYGPPADATLLDDLRAIPELTRTVPLYVRDACAKAANRLSLLESIVSKIVRGDPHGQAHFDIEYGVIDAHADFSPEEQDLLREFEQTPGQPT